MRSLFLLFIVTLAFRHPSYAGSKAASAAACKPKTSCQNKIDSANLNCQYPDQTDDVNEKAWRAKIQTDDASLTALAAMPPDQRPSMHEMAILTQERNQYAGSIATTKGKKCLDAIDDCHTGCPASCTATCDRDNQNAYSGMIRDGYAAQVAANKAGQTAANNGD